MPTRKLSKNQKVSWIDIRTDKILIGHVVGTIAAGIMADKEYMKSAFPKCSLKCIDFQKYRPRKDDAYIIAVLDNNNKTYLHIPHVTHLKVREF